MTEPGLTDVTAAGDDWGDMFSIDKKMQADEDEMEKINDHVAALIGNKQRLWKDTSAARKIAPPPVEAKKRKSHSHA